MMTDTHEQAWRKGLEAGRACLAAGANPYRGASALATEWHDGWREGAHPRNQPMDLDAWDTP